MSTVTVTTTAFTTTEHQLLHCCEECQQGTAIYKCPRCGRKTCSIQCCRTHKLREQCNGKRDKTKFMPLAHMSDSTIQSDYLFLEDIFGRVDAGKRLLRQVGANHSTTVSTNNPNKRPRQSMENTGSEQAIATQPPHALLQTNSIDSCTNINTRHVPGVDSQTSSTLQLQQQQHHQHQQQLSPKWRNFQRLAASRRTNVLFMPHGMTRHQSNLSYVKKDVIHWTVEFSWHGPDPNATAHKIILSQLCETSIVEDALLSHAKEMAMELVLLSPYKLLLKILPSKANQRMYRELASRTTLKEALQHATVYEFPTIEIVPNTRWKDFALLIAEIKEEKNTTIPP